MEDDGHFKKINVGETFLQSKSRKKPKRLACTTRDQVSQLKPLSVKELLLKKLQQYKKEKSRKNRHSQQPSFQNPSSQEFATTPSLTTSFLQNTKKIKKKHPTPPKMNHVYGRQEPEHPGQPEYGNLKNGIKPTYRQLCRNKTMK